ncbi:hypothetical protein PFUGPA_05083 [Plasmodium falciparum Palo Alto/Uganda]|uniref:Uncharacterized protein n=1 Tax=Plasmodium falciparum (isolate Palo Alto / Uganda) TaxID=57270 RepID=W4ITX4_PLAFP|nr:hypothetical protein PFUGPA_05083 [Plasmodium falciparum Palo Alto/Uganda]
MHVSIRDACPLDLPSGVTINLGLRRRKYSSNEPKNNTYLKNELNDDAKIIKDAIYFFLISESVLIIGNGMYTILYKKKTKTKTK